jgi:DNA repair protein RadC
MNNAMRTENNPEYLGHRQRIKDKYKAAGLDGWHDYEVLELALGYAFPRRDTKPLAKALIAKYKTLGAVLDTDTQALCSELKISEHSALFIRLLRDIARLYYKDAVLRADPVSSPSAAVTYLTAALKGCRDEEFHALFLDAQNRVIATEAIHEGTVNRSVIYPRKIVERALHYKANSAIIAHNHPGGSLKPSEDDRQATIAVQKALETVEITLLDHIIIGGTGYFSFKENDLL